MTIIALQSSLSSSMAAVVVGRVDHNGSCAGLLTEGDTILYLNGTPVATSQDVHAFLSSTKPNQTVIVTTEFANYVVQLGGESTGKLGIGIVNANRSLLFLGKTDLPRQAPAPGPAPADEKPARLPIGIIMSIEFAIIILILRLSSGTPLHRFLGFSGSVSEDHSDAYRCIMLFAVAAVARIASNLAYFLRFGWHATNVMELWFYVDVAKGYRYFLNPFNPTIWILRLFSLASPEKIPLYSTVASSIILSSLVSVLIYLLIKDIHGPKAGLLSGLIYGLLVQPLALSTASFTQHITQIPVSLLFLLFLWRAMKGRGIRRLIYLLALLPTGLLGYLVNIEIFIYFGMGYLMVSIAVVRWFLAERNSDTGAAFIALMLAVGLLALPLYAYFDRIMSFSVALTPKEALNESSVQMVHPPTVTFLTAVPLPASSYLRLYGIYLLFVPFGIYFCWRHRDPLPYIFLVFGALTCLHWARGSRILDIGIAMLAGISLGSWRSDWDLVASFMAVPLLVASLLFFPQSNLQPYLALGISGLLAIFLCRRMPYRASAMAIIGISCSLSVFTAGVLYVDPIKSTEAEFEALTWLGENSEPGERILTSLDRGHLPHAISGLDSVSDEYNLRPEIAKAFYQTEELAALTLAENNVTYVMVSSDDLTIGEDSSGRPAINLRGYATFDQNLADAEIPLTLFFRLTYPDPSLRYFEEIYTSTSGSTTVRIYRLRRALLEEVDRAKPSERTALSIVAHNPNDLPVSANLLATITDCEGNLRSLDAIRVDFGPRENISLACDYPIRPIPGSRLEVELVETRWAMTPMTVRGFVVTNSSGLYLFRYILDNSESRTAYGLLLEGRNSFTHELDGGGTDSLVIRSLSITPVEPWQSTAHGSVEIGTPGPSVEAIQLLFSEID